MGAPIRIAIRPGLSQLREVIKRRLDQHLEISVELRMEDKPDRMALTRVMGTIDAYRVVLNDIDQMEAMSC